jgi:hypothetical protein
MDKHHAISDTIRFDGQTPKNTIRKAETEPKKTIQN